MPNEQQNGDILTFDFNSSKARYEKDLCAQKRNVIKLISQEEEKNCINAESLTFAFKRKIVIYKEESIVFAAKLLLTNVIIVNLDIFS